MASTEVVDLSGLASLVYGLPANLSALRFPLPLPSANQADDSRRALTAQLNDYLLPRITSMDAPLLAVVGGSTGAGKSTLVNSIIGREVTAPGVLRPTTKSPVLVFNPANEMWFDSDRILPGLVRSTAPTADARALQLVADDHVPVGIALLDAPDIDSIDASNRSLAATLLAAADLWLFVTSAARYADAVPWDFLNQAAARGAAVAVILDRVPQGSLEQVPGHLAELMAQRGLGAAKLFVVPEAHLADGRLPASLIGELTEWLNRLATETTERQAMVRQTMLGTLQSLTPRVRDVAVAAKEQEQAVAALREDAESAFTQARSDAISKASDGTLLRGEVLARWQEIVGSGAVMRVVEQKVSWLKDRVIGALSSVPAEAQELQVAAVSGLEAMLISEAGSACERVDRVWREAPAGRFVMNNNPGLAELSGTFTTEVRSAIRDWRGDVMSLVSAQGESRRSRAKFMALGVNGLGAALMVLVFASTGGLTGAEVGIAGGTTLIAQKVLEAAFGDGAVRKLTSQATELLDDRIAALFSLELAKFERALDAVPVDEDANRAVRQIADDLGVALAAQSLA